MGSAIEWTNETWNPVVGCSLVSEGCRNCYAAREALRLAGNPNEAVRDAYAGTSEMRGEGAGRRPVFTGTVRCLPDRLPQPLRWRKPRLVFVNSMSDLFHESVPFSYVDDVFRVMALAPQHTFQILTKRPGRMRAYFHARRFLEGVRVQVSAHGLFRQGVEWPLRNVWLGTSVEDQVSANARIPYLAACPAELRFLSCEPLLGRVDIFDPDGDVALRMRNGHPLAPFPSDAIGWVIVGGESGPRARPCSLEWIQWVVDDAASSGVPVFVKQLGADVRSYRAEPSQLFPESVVEYRVKLRDRKGGDPEEWPEALRVREMPRGYA